MTVFIVVTIMGPSIFYLDLSIHNHKSTQVIDTNTEVIDIAISIRLQMNAYSLYGKTDATQKCSSMSLSYKFIIRCLWHCKKKKSVLYAIERYVLYGSIFWRLPIVSPPTDVLYPSAIIENRQLQNKMNLNKHTVKRFQRLSSSCAMNVRNEWFIWMILWEIENDCIPWLQPIYHVNVQRISQQLVPIDPSALPWKTSLSNMMSSVIIVIIEHDDDLTPASRTRWIQFVSNVLQNRWG